MGIHFEILPLLQEFIFFQDETIQKLIEISFGKSVALSGETWKNLVENLCSYAMDLKKSFEEQYKAFNAETMKLKENLELLKKEKSKVDSELMSVERILKEIYDQKVKSYEEKVIF